MISFINTQQLLLNDKWSSAWQIWVRKALFQWLLATPQIIVKCCSILLIDVTLICYYARVSISCHIHFGLSVEVIPHHNNSLSPEYLKAIKSLIEFRYLQMGFSVRRSHMGPEMGNYLKFDQVGHT